MASTTQVVNGVTLTINPFINKVNAPNHAGLSTIAYVAYPVNNFFPPNNFDSSDKTPVLITPDKPLSDFGIDFIGSHAAGNFIVGYDINGKELLRKEASYDDSHTGYTARMQITAGVNQAFYSVRLMSTNCSAYGNIAVTPGTAPVVNPPTPPATVTIPVPTPTTNIPDNSLPNFSSSVAGGLRVNLSDIITMSETTIDRAYIKGTLTAIKAEPFVLRNTSKNIDVDVVCKGISGVSFTPSSFTLKASHSQSINVAFDPVQIDKLPEGVTTITTIISLSSNTVLAVPVGAATNPNASASLPPLALPDTNEDWLEERFNGSPLSIPLATIYAGKSVGRTFNGDINYVGENQIPAPTTVRWTKTGLFNNENYTFVMNADDGMRVYLDGKLILNGWQKQGATSYQITLAMTPGSHDIKVEYFNDNNIGVAQFNYYPGGIPGGQISVKLDT